MQWLNLRFLSFFHSLLRFASVVFSLCVRFSNVWLTCTDMCPPISISPCAQKVLRFGFSFFFFLFWLCFVYWTTWDSWLSVVVGVADTRNFVFGDDSFPLYASISVSLGRGWWGRLEGTGGTSCCELVFHNKPSQPPLSHFVRHHANAPKLK